MWLKNHQSVRCARAILAVAFVVVSGAASLGCASAVSRTVVVPSGSQETSVAVIFRVLAGLGYQVQAVSEEAGAVTASRPVSGKGALFSFPGMGHQVSVTVEDGSYVVEVFPLEGVWGALSPSEVAEEIRGALNGQLAK